MLVCLRQINLRLLLDARNRGGLFTSTKKLFSTNRHSTDLQIGRQADTQTGRQIDRQTGRQTDRQADMQTGRQKGQPDRRDSQSSTARQHRHAVSTQASSAHLDLLTRVHTYMTIDQEACTSVCGSLPTACSGLFCTSFAAGNACGCFNRVGSGCAFGSASLCRCC